MRIGDRATAAEPTSPATPKDPVRIYHPIPVSSFDRDVVRVVRRLRRHHYQAYLVGGCVRDLLLGVTPKDFDVATSARPEEVRSLFRNSRIIGRRFLLVHVFFKGGKIIEVATFRQQPGVRAGSEPDDLLIKEDNNFGSPEQDARRRDFTINGLFYDLHSREIVDHVHGLEDVDARLLRAIGDPNVRIPEDPVRILRAIKFSARLGLTIEDSLWEAMIRYRWELMRSSPPRVLEEILRILRSGKVYEGVSLMHRAGVLEVLLPEVHEYLSGEHEGTPQTGDAEGGFWRLLRLHDGLDRSPKDYELLALLLYLPMLRRFHMARPRANIGDLVEGLVNPLAKRLHVARRETELLRQTLMAERKLFLRKRRLNRRDPILRRPCIDEGVDLFELGCLLSGQGVEKVKRVKELMGRSITPMCQDLRQKTSRPGRRKAQRSQRKEAGDSRASRQGRDRSG